MTIDPETARQLLGLLQKQIPHEPTADEDAFLWWEVQRRIAWGGLDQAKNITDEKAHTRSNRLAHLHTQITAAASAGIPEPAAATAERDALMKEIQAEAEKALEDAKAAVASGRQKDIWTSR